MSDFINDRGFLQEVNKYKVKQYYAAIMMLDFETEEPLGRIEGKIVSGSMSISGKSNTRRTGSMQVIFDRTTFDLTNVDNLIAINKKFSFSVGIDNPFYDQVGEWRLYGPILWFKQGLFLITQVSSSLSTTSRTISMNFIDKMGMLNGVCGGTIPASVSLHDRLSIDADGNQTTTLPLIRDIIREVVNHFGGENISRIEVSDIPEFGRQVVIWNGQEPIRFTNMTSSSVGVTPIISSRNNPNFPNVYTRGDEIGYMSTRLTYPGELVMKAGTTVTGVLDEMVKTLGNFEYFYDVDGVFHFQRIRNFEMTGQTPMISGNPSTSTPFNIGDTDNSSFQQRYFPNYNEDQFLNEFANTELVTSVSFNPQYANIKNDFVVWGSRKAANGDESMVRYHLAIDDIPRKGYVDNDNRDSPVWTGRSLCDYYIWEVKSEENRAVTRYIFTLSAGVPSVNSNEFIENDNYISVPLNTINSNYTFDWREELYRRALRAFGTATVGSYYDPELLAEWRQIFDPMNVAFQRDWINHFASRGAPAWTGYNPLVVSNPKAIRFWLDIIDSSAALGAYSVKRIGRRSIVKENNKINEVLVKEIPDIVFIDASEDNTLVSAAMKELQSIGQPYALIQPEVLRYFGFQSSFGTCYEEVRDLMRRHLMYNATVSLTSIPLLYLDVNKVIHLNFHDLGIGGNFVINTISWNLGQMATMSISASEAVVIV